MQKHFFTILFYLCFGVFNILLAQQKDTLSYQQALDNFHNKEYVKTLKQILQLKERYTKEDNVKMLNKTFRLQGFCHKKTGNYKRAITCYLKALKGFRKQKDTALLIGICNNLVITYHFQKKYDSAIYYSQASLRYNHFCVDSISKIRVHSNLSGLYIRKEKYDLAIKHSDSALSLIQARKNNVKGLKSAYNNRAGIYYKQKKYELAKEYYLKSYALFDETTVIEDKKSTLQNLTMLYLLLGEREKAKNFFLKTFDLNDSLQKLKYDSKITEIEDKYNVNKEIQVTNLERQKKKQLQLWLLAVSLLLLGIISIIWFYYRDNKVKKERLALRLVNQELEQFQKIKKLQLQNQNKVLNAVTVGKETERIAIAQVLHDSVGALLSSANMHLQVVKKKTNQDIEEIQKSQNIIEEASNKVRNLSHQLISEVLLKFGLEVAIESLCTKYSNADLVFELVTENEIPRFAQAFEIKMHSIIEEMLNNAIKHSQASEVVVSLKCQENMLTVIVEDNGIGLNVAKVNEFESVGLAQIKARVESSEGVFIITSILHKYARFYIKIPVEV